MTDLLSLLNKMSFSELYDLNYDTDILEKYLNEIYKNLKENNIVIDAGCGTGLFSKNLEKKSSIVYGLDNDEEMLNFASKRLKKTKLIEHDLRNPWPIYGDFIIMMNDVINYFEKPLKVIENAINSLNDKGIIVFDIYNNPKSYIQKNHEGIIFHWKRTVRFKKINHLVRYKEKEYSVVQYIHNIKKIVRYLRLKGFRVNKISKLVPEKVLIVAEL